MSKDEQVTHGGCLCGAVRYEVKGTLDAPTGLKTLGHIFVGEKADFFEIADDLPQYETSSEGKFVDDYK